MGPLDKAGYTLRFSNLRRAEQRLIAHPGAKAEGLQDLHVYMKGEEREAPGSQGLHLGIVAGYVELRDMTH